LNEGTKSEQPTRPVDLRHDGVEIDLPSREDIEGVLKYLKNNKTAGADSIAAELLKDGGPNLVDALHAVIQQAWTGETLPRSWTEGVLCPVYKKGDKLDCKTINVVNPDENYGESRLQTANRFYFGLRNYLQSSHLSRQTKFTIHKTLIHPVLLYGSETWVLTKREDNQLFVFESKVLRMIGGLKIENGVYRRRSNHELDKEFDSANALNVTKTCRLRYAGHMIRTTENLPQKARFRAKSNGRRNLGRPT
jgi:hypothetical protein